jgi:hypothetical protein
MLLNVSEQLAARTRTTHDAGMLNMMQHVRAGLADKVEN